MEVKGVQDMRQYIISYVNGVKCDNDGKGYPTVLEAEAVIKEAFPSASVTKQTLRTRWIARDVVGQTLAAIEVR